MEATSSKGPYCFRCKSHTDAKDLQEVQTANKRMRRTGTCGTCNGKVSTFYKKQQQDMASKKAS